MVKYSVTINLVPQPKKDGTHLIRFRISFLGDRLVYYAPYSIPKNQWNEKRCICKAGYEVGHVTTSIVNKSINDIVSGVDDYFASCDINDERPTVKNLKKKLDGECRSKVEFDNRVSAVIHEFIDTCSAADSWAKNTSQKFVTLEKHLIDMNSRITMEDFGEDGLIDIVNYWHSIGHRNSTIAKELNLLKWFLRWAYKHKYLKTLDFVEFRPRLKGVTSTPKNKFYLTWEEVMTLEQLEGLLPYQERVRDCFLFQCFTGLRYSDLSNLTRSNIHDDAIHILTVKDTDNLVIELNDHSRKILDKYKNQKFEHDRPLPVISNVKMNSFIKEVCKIAGLDTTIQTNYMRGSKMVKSVNPKYELISTHVGRHTFIVHSLRLGIPTEVVMKWTGHSDYDSMRPYIEIVDEIKKESMEKFNK